MSESWLSSEDSPCPLVCFLLLQVPLSQLCLSSVYLSYDLLLLSMTPDHHITLMIYIQCLPILRETCKGILQSADPHIACTLHWFGKKRCLVRSLFESTAFNFSTSFPTFHPHQNQPDVNSGPVVVVPSLPPPPPGQLCLSLPAFYCFAKARMDSPPLP